MRNHPPAMRGYIVIGVTTIVVGYSTNHETTLGLWYDHASNRAAQGMPLILIQASHPMSKRTSP
jgi:hypothetical protein